MQSGVHFEIACRVDLIEQGFGVAGFREAVEGAQPYARQGRVDRGVPAENDHFGRVAPLAKGLKDFDALNYFVSIQEFIKSTEQFPIQKCAIFCKFKEIGGIARRRTMVRRTSDPVDLSRFSVIDADLSRGRRGVAEKGHLWKQTTSHSPPGRGRSK